MKNLTAEKLYTPEEALVEAQQLRAIVSSGKVNNYASAEAELEYQQRKESEAQKKEQELIKSFGGKHKYKQVLAKMPEAVKYLKEIGVDSVSVEDCDPDNQLMILKGSRSEWGSSGGIAYYSRVIAWCNGQLREDEFQWRDRWSASNDKPRYHFNKLAIAEARLEGQDLAIRIKATPDQKYQPTYIDFKFKMTNAQQPENTLSPHEQEAFKKHVEREISRIMEEKDRLWKAKPTMLYNPRVKMTLPTGTPAYVRYERPSITAKLVKEKIGVGTFIAKEQIDNRSSDPQFRHEVYLVRSGQEAQMIDEDHAYLYGEGDASIIGLRQDNDQIVYKKRSGQKKIKI
jgi:hypothetical protein